MKMKSFFVLLVYTYWVLEIKYIFHSTLIYASLFQLE